MVEFKLIAWEILFSQKMLTFKYFYFHNIQEPFYYKNSKMLITL